MLGSGRADSAVVSELADYCAKGRVHGYRNVGGQGGGGGGGGGAAHGLVGSMAGRRRRAIPTLSRCVNGVVHPSHLPVTPSPA